MKGIQKIVVFLLVAFLAFSFVGCGEQSGENAPVSNNEEVVLYDFEQGLFNVRMNGSFGKITLNKDEKYVFGGKQSAKLEPSENLDPFMYLPMESTLLGFSYIDLKKIGTISFKIYSTGKATLNVGLYFSDDASMKNAPTQYEIQEGWNTIVYKPQYSVIMIQYELEDFKGVFIGLKGKSENPPTLYLDDVSIIKTDAIIEVENLIVLTQTTEYFEICDFEKAYQNIVFVSTGKGYAKNVEVVDETKAGVKPSSGKKMLKVELSEQSGSGTSWTQISMVPSLLQAINFKQFQGHLSEYSLKFDVYRDFDEHFAENGQFDTLVEINAYYNAYGSMDWGGITLTQKGVWMEYSAPLTNYGNFVENPYSFYISFMDKKLQGSYVYYFDNFRIEKNK